MILKEQREMHLFQECFLSFWGSDGGPRGHGYATWLSCTWMRLEEVADRVLVRIKDSLNIILIIFQKMQGQMQLF